MKKRFSEEQIISILKQHESGVKTADVCREHNISANTFYTWNAPRGHPVWRDECFGGTTAASIGSRERQAQAHRG